MNMNSDKFPFGQDTVKSDGCRSHKLGSDLRSIDNYPAPTNISEVRSFFRKINQVNYSFASGMCLAI